MISRTIRSSIFPAVMLVAAVVAAPASAQQMRIVASTPTSTLTVGNLQYSIGTCTYTSVGGSLGSLGVHNCGTADDNLYLVALGGPGSAVEIERLVGGVTQTPILQATQPLTTTNSKKYDLSIQLVIKVVGTHTTVTQGALILAGSVTGTQVPADLTKVTTGETITQATHTPASPTITLITSLASTSVTKAFTYAQTFNQTFSTSKDLKISVSSATHGSTLTLNSVIQRFTPAPEPAAIGAFAVGLLGIGAIRRRGRAKTASA
jgi:hypothetical protein